VARRPNVLLVTIDQWRGDCLSAAGHPLVRTPNLDALSASGTRFAQHHAQTAPCGPSRASLFTGLYAHNHRSVGNGTPLDARFTTLALELRAGGYDPVLFGYTDTTVDPRTVAADDPRLRSYEGLLPGFRFGVELLEDRGPWLAWLTEQGHDPDGLRRYAEACRRWTWDLTLDDVADPAPFPAEHSETAWLTDRALEHLAAAEPGWCVHVAYIRPHPPFIAPPPYHRLHDPADVPAPVRHPTVDDEAAVHPYLAMVLGSTAYRAPADDAVIRQLRATYYGMIAEVDHQFGRLLAGVEAKGELDDTVVVVTSDHGEMLGDHWLVGKVGFHRESYHVPLIVRPARAPVGAGEPGGTGGSVVAAWTEHVDLLPTLLELVDLPRPVQGDGRSLVPLLRGAAVDGWRDATRWEFDYRAWSAGRLWDPRACSLTAQRDAAGAYVHFGALAPLYFDLAEDPHQLVDRAGDPRCREAVLDHAQRLLSWEHASRDEVLASLLVTPEGLRRLGAR
jgi:arylsulfatase A-like enzyme